VTTATGDIAEQKRAKRLRWTYRRQIGRGHEAQWPNVVAEFERLYGRPPEKGEAEFIVKDAWREARQLAGWTYDYGVQGWRRADGTRVTEDDGGEWRHL